MCSCSFFLFLFPFTPVASSCSSLGSVLCLFSFLFFFFISLFHWVLFLAGFFWVQFFLSLSFFLLGLMSLGIGKKKKATPSDVIGPTK